MHSLYDYVQNSSIKDIRAARAISDWHKDSRGVSATFLSIKTDVPKAEIFLQALFGHQEFMSDCFGYLMFGSLLIDWTEFIRILKSEPTGKFGDVRKHPVVRKVYDAMSRSGVSMGLMQTWIDKIRDVWVSENYYGLPVEKAPNCKVDGRPMVQYMTQSTGIIREMRARQVKMERTIQDMQTKNKELEKKLDESNDLLRLVLAKLEGEPPVKKPKLSDNTTDDQVSEAPAEDQCKAAIPEVSVPDWDSEVETSLTNTGNLSYFLYYWYNNDAEESYANYIAQEYAGVKVNQTLKTRMSKLRRIKNFLVANLPVCDEDPLTNQTILAKPVDVSNYNVWKKNLNLHLHLRILKSV